MWRDLEAQVATAEGAEGSEAPDSAEPEKELPPAPVAGVVRRGPAPRGRRVFRSSYVS